MKTKITLVILAIAVVVILPTSAQAQRTGFVVGLAPRALQQSIAIHRVEPFVQPFMRSPWHWLPRGQLMPQDQVIFIDQPTMKIGPLPDRSVGPVVSPYLSVATPRGAGAFPHPRPGDFVGTEIVQPRRSSVVVNRPRINKWDAGVLTGLPRADVFQRFGPPTIAIFNAHSETLIFGGTTIIIQNGLVAFVQ